MRSIYARRRVTPVADVHSDRNRAVLALPEGAVCSDHSYAPAFTSSVHLAVFAWSEAGPYPKPTTRVRLRNVPLKRIAIVDPAPIRSRQHIFTRAHGSES